MSNTQSSNSDTTEQSIAHLWSTYRQIDSQIGTTNAKAAVLIGLNTFLLGGLLLKANSDFLKPMANSPEARTAVVWLMVATASLSALSLGLLMAVVCPHFHSVHRDWRGFFTPKRPDSILPGKSLIFFEHIWARTTEEYFEDCRKESPRERQKDLAGEVHSVAAIAYRKFVYLRTVALLVIALQLPILLTLLLVTLFASS